MTGVQTCALPIFATYVIETVGTQEYSLGQEHFLRRLTEAYGEQAAAEIAPVVACLRA